MRRPAERLLFLRWASKIALFLLVCAAASICHAQVDPVVCSAGDGNFETAFRTGVKVEVGPARRDGLATRMCQGTLKWEKQSLVVAPSAFEVDIDALGVDLGLGTPVVTFQVKQAEADCCRTLLIYSLQKPPKLLRTITGGGVYSTADRNLNGELEIWMNDASSMAAFEGPAFRQPELAPLAVLTFFHGKLLDAGSEFQSYFDDAIAEVRSKLKADDLRSFKESDGRLPSHAVFSPEEQQRSEDLQHTKIGVLQIVWFYLYSGREPEAWKALADLWPPDDLERIKAEIVRARAQGVLSHVDGVSTARRPTANTVRVFDLRTRAQPALPMSNGRRGPAMAAPTPLPTVDMPIPIFVAHLVSDPASEETIPAQGMLDLTIDAGGKVHSAHGTDPTLDAWFKGDTASWKFIPAMSEGQAVASRIYLVLTPKQ